MEKVFKLSKFYNNMALTDDLGISLTYGELEEYCEDLYKCINKRTLVFILCSNTVASVIGYISFINNEVVPILLDKNIDDLLLDNLIDKYKPEYIWLPKDKKINIECNEIKDIFGYRLLKTNNIAPKMYDELCLMVTTSGSTGSPKFVRISYKNIIDCAKADSNVDAWKVIESDRAITTMPVSYMYTLLIMNMHMIRGAGVLLTSKSVLEKEFWDFFENNDVTYMGGVSFTYEMLERIGFSKTKYPSIKYLTQAGSKMPSDLQIKMAECAKQNGYKFYVNYGSTETAGWMSYLPFEDVDKKIGSIGISIPFGHLYLTDDDNNIITDNNIEGELTYEGINVTLGYAECIEDLTKKDERKGKYKTGDLAYQDNDGYFFIVGRRKRFLKVYGKRVSLDEIEQLIKDEFKSNEIAVSGIDDHIKIYTTIDNLGNRINNYLANKTKLPIVSFKTIVIKVMPRNNYGKILYKELDKFN